MLTIRKIKNASIVWNNVTHSEYVKEHNIIIIMFLNGMSLTYATKMNPFSKVSARLTVDEFDILKKYILGDAPPGRRII